MIAGLNSPRFKGAREIEVKAAAEVMQFRADKIQLKGKDYLTFKVVGNLLKDYKGKTRINYQEIRFYPPAGKAGDLKTGRGEGEVKARWLTGFMKWRLYVERMGIR